MNSTKDQLSPTSIWEENLKDIDHLHNVTGYRDDEKKIKALKEWLWHDGLHLEDFGLSEDEELGLFKGRAILRIVNRLRKRADHLGLQIEDILDDGIFRDESPSLEIKDLLNGSVQDFKKPRGLKITNANYGRSNTWRKSN